jgi:hypothetical protein
MIIASHVPIGVYPHKSVLGGKDTDMDWFDNSDNSTSMRNRDACLDRAQVCGRSPADC